jgi:uncharacterized membrane protein
MTNDHFGQLKFYGQLGVNKFTANDHFAKGGTL